MTTKCTQCQAELPDDYTESLCATCLEKNGDPDNNDKDRGDTKDEPDQAMDDSLIRALFPDREVKPVADEGDEDKPDEDKPDEDKPDEDKPDEDKPDEDKPDADEDDEGKPDEGDRNEDPPNAGTKAKKRVEIVVDDDLLDRPAPTHQPPQPDDQESWDKDVAEFIKTLNEEQKEELAEAEWAEKNMGDRYKGHPKELVQWYQRFDEKVRKLQEADPDRTFDEDDDEYQRLLKTKPTLKEADYRKVTRGLSEDRAVERVRQEQAAKFAEIERWKRKQELTPKVEKLADQFEKNTIEVFGESEELSAVTQALNSGEESELKLEVDVVKEVASNCKRVARKFVEVVNQLDTYNPESPDPDHKWLVDFVTKQDQIMLEHGGDRKVRDGKTFTTRARWIAMSEEERAKHWIHTDRDILTMIALNGRNEAINRIQEEHARMERYGLVRRDSTEKVNKKQNPKPTGAPKVPVSKAKGAATAKEKDQPANPFGASLVSSLGMRSS